MSEVPKRRLRLTLDLGADDLDELGSALHTLANDLEADGVEERDVTSGGYGSGYHLLLTVTDPAMDAERFQRDLKDWVAQRKAKS